MNLAEKIYPLKEKIKFDAFLLVLQNIADSVEEEGDDLIYIFQDGSAIIKVDDSIKITNEHYDQLNSKSA